jgi:hypothetical protein
MNDLSKNKQFIININQIILEFVPIYKIVLQVLETQIMHRKTIKLPYFICCLTSWIVWALFFLFIEFSQC